MRTACSPGPWERCQTICCSERPLGTRKGPFESGFHIFREPTKHMTRGNTLTSLGFTLSTSVVSSDAGKSCESGAIETVTARFWPWLYVLDRLRVGWLNVRAVLREQNMLVGHLPKVIYHQVYLIKPRWLFRVQGLGFGGGIGRWAHKMIYKTSCTVNCAARRRTETKSRPKHQSGQKNTKMDAAASKPSTFGVVVLLYKERSNLTATSSQESEAVPRRARIQGS